MNTRILIQQKLQNIFNLAQKYMSVLGVVFVCLSFVFIYLKIDQNFFTLVQKHQLTNFTVTLILTASLAYVAVSQLLAIAWSELLVNNEIKLPKKLLMSIFGKSQIAKYLPGNVFHFIGRQVLSKDYGYSHAFLANSTIWEVALHALAAALMGILLLITCTPFYVSIVLIITYVIVIFTGLPILKNLINGHRILALGYYCSFHVLSALIFATILYLNYAEDITAQIFLISMGAYIIAWLVGFVTPGAPGGLGIREFILFLLLSPWVDHSTILVAMAISRLVTIIGDVLFFLLSIQLGREYFKPMTN